MLRIGSYRRRYRSLVGFCGFLWFALACMPVFAQAPPSADTFVSSATPVANYGPSITLVVQPGTNTYVKFNLATLPPGATITKATLRLYVDAVAKSGSFDVYRVTSDWSERAVTYNTAPNVGRFSDRESSGRGDVRYQVGEMDHLQLRQCPYASRHRVQR